MNVLFDCKNVENVIYVICHVLFLNVMSFRKITFVALSISYYLFMSIIIRCCVITSFL